MEEEFYKWKEENLSNILVEKGANKNLQIYLSELEFNEAPINKNNIKDIEVKISCSNILKAPIEANECIGKVEVLVDDDVITVVNIMVKSRVEKKNILDYMKDFIINYNVYLQESIKSQ